MSSDDNNVHRKPNPPVSKSGRTEHLTNTLENHIPPMWLGGASDAITISVPGNNEPILHRNSLTSPIYGRIISSLQTEEDERQNPRNPIDTSNPGPAENLSRKFDNAYFNSKRILNGQTITLDRLPREEDDGSPRAPKRTYVSAFCDAVGAACDQQTVQDLSLRSKLPIKDETADEMPTKYSKSLASENFKAIPSKSRLVDNLILYI